MAENYDLIFGQSASQQYAWSDSDYQNGWQTVGSTPPTAEQFDALQRRSDTKAQELNSRLTPIEAKSEADGRQMSTAYALGDEVTADGLPNGWLLECVVEGTSGSSAITIPATLIDGATIADGTVTWKLRKVATEGGLGYRQPSTAYAVGNIVYHTALSMQKLVCVQGGTTASGAVTPSTTEGALVTDGTVTWQVDSLADGNYTAIHQNGIAGGRDITAYWESGIMSTNIHAGKFVGMHIGDYIIKSIVLPAMTYTDKSGTSVTQDAQTFSNAKWLVGAFDPHLHCGDTETTAHHILLIPASTLQRKVKMNPTNDTAGAYVGSDMWTKIMPIWTAAIKEAFGAGHVLSHMELLANVTSTTVQSTGGSMTGKSSNFTWVTVEGANIPNEAMVYGGSVFGSGYDVGDFPRMLPLYALKCNHLEDRSWFWLRAVASSLRFAYASGSGTAHYADAAYSNAYGGVRPYFLYR